MSSKVDWNRSLLRHSMDSTEMPISIFQLEFTIKSKLASITSSMLFALPTCSTSFGLKLRVLWRP